MVKKVKNEQTLNMRLILLTLVIEVAWGCLFMDLNLLWMGIVELIVAALILVGASQSRSGKVKAFLWMGAVMLIVLAGYQLIHAFA